MTLRVKSAAPASSAVEDCTLLLLRLPEAAEIFQLGGGATGSLARVARNSSPADEAGAALFTLSVNSSCFCPGIQRLDIQDSVL